jgi:hypothetical protein
MKPRSPIVLRALLLLVPAACTSSGLGDPASTPPTLATLRGSIATADEAKTSAPAGSIRIELAWFTPGSQGTRIVSQDVPVTAALPADFSLPLDGAPPAEALWTHDNYTAQYLMFQSANLPQPAPGQSFALGQVFAYADLNGNGTLDMVGEGATSAPDRIIAADSGGGHVLYTTGGYGQVSYQAPDGYGLLERTDGAHGPGSGPIAWSPISTSVTMRAANAEWNLMMCTNYNPLLENNDLIVPTWVGVQGLRDAPIWTSDVPLPPVDQPLLSCSPGGTQFCIDACPAPAGAFYVCQAYDTSANPLPDHVFQSYCDGRFGASAQCYTMPAAQPPGWPCPVTPGIDCTPDPKSNGCASADTDGGPPPPIDAGVPTPGDGG